MPTNSTLLIMVFVPSMIAATQWDVAVGFLCLYHSGFDKYNKSNVIASSVSACYLLLRLLDQLRSVKTPKKIKIKNQRCGRFFVVRFFVVFFFLMSQPLLLVLIVLHFLSRPSPTIVYLIYPCTCKT